MLKLPKWLFVAVFAVGASFYYMNQQGETPERLTVTEDYKEGDLLASLGDSPKDDEFRGQGLALGLRKCETPMPIFPMPDFDYAPGNGKWVLVTGVSRGNGRAIAERFHELGYRVIGTYRSDPALTYQWPKFKPGRAPDIDHEVVFDTTDVRDPVKLNQFLTTVSNLVGSDGLSVIVPSGLDLFVGTEQGTYLAGNSAIRDEAIFTIGDAQFRLVMELLFSGVVDIRPDVRVIPIVSQVAWSRTSPFFSAYHMGKDSLKVAIDTLAQELSTLPGANAAIPEIRFSKINPALVDSGGLDKFPGFPQVGPGLGEFVPLDAFNAISKSNATARPIDVGNAVVQAAQLPEPPTDVYVMPTVANSKLGRAVAEKSARLQHCGDREETFKPFYHAEFSQQGTLEAYAGTDFTQIYDFPIVALFDPTNNETLGITGTSPARKFIFSGVNLDGPNMVWEVKLNNGPWTRVDTTYVPANFGQALPPSFADTWVQDDEVDFSSYSGQTVKVAIRGTTADFNYRNDKNALNVYEIQIDVP